MDEWLNKEELKRAEMLIGEIDDYYKAIQCEIYSGKANRNYLRSKMNSMAWDVNCLKILISGEE